MAQGPLGDLVIVGPLVIFQGLFQIRRGVEALAAQDLGDSAIEALHHAVGLRVSWRDQAVLDVRFLAHLVERMIAGGLAFSRSAETIGKLLPVVGEDLADLEWCFFEQSLQEGLSRLGALVLADLQVHPASGPVDGHEQILAGCLVLHLGQVLDVDVHKARLVGLEPLVGLGSGLVAIPLPLQGPDVGHTVTAEAAIQRRTAQTGLDEFPDHDQQVVQGQQQQFTDGHHHRLLGLCQRGAQAMGTGRGILGADALAPLGHCVAVNTVSARQRGVAHRQGRHLDLPSNTRGGASVGMDRRGHGFHSFRSSRNRSISSRARNNRSRLLGI